MRQDFGKYPKIGKDLGKGKGKVYDVPKSSELHKILGGFYKLYKRVCLAFVEWKQN